MKKGGRLIVDIGKFQAIVYDSESVSYWYMHCIISVSKKSNPSESDIK